jgi:hypothetical protein
MLEYDPVLEQPWLAVEHAFNSTPRINRSSAIVLEALLLPAQ